MHTLVLTVPEYAHIRAVTLPFRADLYDPTDPTVSKLTPPLTQERRSKSHLRRGDLGG